MNKKSIQQLATCAKNCPNSSIEITYADTGRIYRVVGFIKIKHEGQWFVHVKYISMCESNKGERFSRDSTDFGKFREVVI